MARRTSHLTNLGPNSMGGERERKRGGEEKERKKGGEKEKVKREALPSL